MTEGILAKLATVADDIGPALVPPAHSDLLEEIAETAKSLFRAAACSIALLEREESSGEERLTFSVAVGRGADSVEDLSFPITEGIAGFVARSGQPLMIEEVGNDPRFAGPVADLTGYRPSSIAAAPLLADRGVIGVLEVLDPDPGSTGRGQGMELLGHLAAVAALAVESAEVFHDLGGVLFRVAAEATSGSDEHLANAFREVARTSRGSDRELTEIAELFLRLRRLGEEERHLATSVLLPMLRYAVGVQGAK